MRSIRFVDDSLAQMSKWLIIDRKKLGKILRLLEEIKRTPFDGTGKPESLKGNLKGKRGVAQRSDELMMSID
jgi:toxin YoeB